MSSGEVRAPVATRWVIDFADGSREMRNLLGGKGANVAEMTRLLGEDRVPAGFTITTDACVAYMTRTSTALSDLQDEVEEALDRLEKKVGKRLGDAADPLLVSVRSGARASMPGMLDTILNLGLNEGSVEGLARRTNNPRFAWDCYRRFVHMFGEVVRGVPGERFEEELRRTKRERGVTSDSELDADALRAVTLRCKAFYEFPVSPREQLDEAIVAVFRSWTNERAVAYRRINGIPDEWGTAVNVQQMVFGNKGPTSGSGVAFSRNELTGAPDPSGDFLANAQGEDVVSGLRTPLDICDLKSWQPELYGQLMDILRLLERHYKDMQDTEWTVEEGRLYMLQTRSAKRPAQAAVRFAVDAVEEGLLTPAEAILTIDAENLGSILRPVIAPDAEADVLTHGIGASPGAGAGEVVFTTEEAVVAASDGRDVILVRPFTEADDVAGFYVAKGVLTSTGGKASHAAVVARSMGVPAVTGAEELEIDVDAREVRKSGQVVLRAGDVVTVDGVTGAVSTERASFMKAEPADDFLRVLEWSDEIRRLGVRTDARTTEDVRRGLELGADGVGWCAIEPQRSGSDGSALLTRILEESDAGVQKEVQMALVDELQARLEPVFELLGESPVTISLLELLPPGPGSEEGGPAPTDAVRSARGARLGVLLPDVYEVQVRAAMRAAHVVRGRSGIAPHLELMVPGVSYELELERTRELVERVGHEEGVERSEYSVGAGIATPRACLVADRVAAHAAFLSFATEQLTESTTGLTRAELEGAIGHRYLEERIFDGSPLETLDVSGVGELLRTATSLARTNAPDLLIGMTGAHGGDPKSIKFAHDAGLDYVSCPPERVPVARVAAAQAALRARGAAV